jgi:DNA polymerase-1
MPRAKSPKPPSEPPDVALFDSYSLLFRAFHALPPLTTKAGEPTSALYGFCSVVIRVLREQRPARLAFALDAPARTFRAQRYAGYKAGRPSTPSALSRQIARLEELLGAFEAPLFCAPGFEADDVLATLCHRLEREEQRSVVVSGDRDLLQLVGPLTNVLFVGARQKAPVLFDEPAITARFELPASKLPSYVALVGDSSDNLPGVPGIGARTAAKLVAEHGSIPRLLENLEQLATPKIREALARHREQALLNEELATLRRDVPLADGPLAAPLTASARARLERLFDELEFKSLIGRLESLDYCGA